MIRRLMGVVVQHKYIDDLTRTIIRFHSIQKGFIVDKISVIFPPCKFLKIFIFVKLYTYLI